MAEPQALEAGVGGRGLTVLKSAATKAWKLAKDNPKARATLSEYVAKATGKPANEASINSTIARGPAGAATVLKAAALAGVNPDELFEKVVLANQADAATMRILADLRNTYDVAQTALDSTAVLHSQGGLGQALFYKEVISYARMRFGGPDGVREAHAKLRAFLAMDTDTVENLLVLHSR